LARLDELGYADLLEGIAEETAGAGPEQFRLRYVPSISRPKEEKNAGWTGEIGRVESLLEIPDGGGTSRLEEILETEITPEDFFCHVCGYDNTIKACQGVLEPRGFRTRKNKREDGSYDMKVESYG